MRHLDGQVSELQGQLLEARELYTALRMRCLEFERQLARQELGGSLGDTSMGTATRRSRHLTLLRQLH